MASWGSGAHFGCVTVLKETLHLRGITIRRKRSANMCSVSYRTMATHFCRNCYKPVTSSYYTCMGGRNMDYCLCGCPVHIWPYTMLKLPKNLSNTGAYFSEPRDFLESADHQYAICHQINEIGKIINIKIDIQLAVNQLRCASTFPYSCGQSQLYNHNNSC